MTDELNESLPPEDNLDGEDAAIIAEARDQGWVPKEDWHGDEADWTDAATFVKRGREINPILRKALEREKKASDKLRAELAELKGTVSELAEYRLKQEKMIYDRAMKDLKAQLREATRDGEFDRVDQIEEAIDQLEGEKPAPKSPPKEDTPKVHPSVVAWTEENKSWYNEDPKNEDLVDYANAVTARLVKQAGANPDPDTILAEVKKRVAQQFPSRFRLPAGGTGDSVSGGATGKGKGFHSLPPDAKAAFERFYKAGYYPGMKKEEAQAEYFSHY